MDAGGRAASGTGRRGGRAASGTSGLDGFIQDLHKGVTRGSIHTGKITVSSFKPGDSRILRLFLITVG